MAWTERQTQAQQALFRHRAKVGVVCLTSDFEKYFKEVSDILHGGFDYEVIMSGFWQFQLPFFSSGLTVIPERGMIPGLMCGLQINHLIVHPCVHPETIAYSKSRLRTSEQIELLFEYMKE